MLSGRGLCDELITRPEESYRLCCVVVCDLETSRISAPYIYDISNRRVNVDAQYHTTQKSIFVFDIQKTVHHVLIIKSNKMHYFPNLFW